MKKSVRCAAVSSFFVFATPFFTTFSPASAQVAVAPPSASTRAATTRAAKKYKHQFDAELVKAVIAGNHGDVQKFLKKGADPNARAADSYRTPVLCSFNEKTNLETVRALIDAGADVEITNSQGNAPLVFAALKNRADIITLLLQRGANIETNKFDGLTALMIAASSGSVNAARTLISSGANVNARSKSNGTALIYGSSSTIAGVGNIVILEMLVAAGADVSVKATNGKRAFQTAADYKMFNLESYLIGIYNRDNKLYNAASQAAGLSNGVFPNAWADVRKALDNGANGRFSNEAGSTPLILLALDAKGFDEATVKRVIAVSDIDAQEKGGFTALHAAAGCNNAKIVALLNASKANLNLKSKDGRTPLDVAIGTESNNVAALLRAAGATTSAAPVASTPAKVIPANSLPKGPLDVLVDGSGGKSALMQAAYDGNTAKIEALLKQGAVIDFPNQEGSTALFFAAYGGEIKAIQALVKAGADINFLNKEGKTPLVSASFAGQVSTIRALVEAGADLKYLSAAIGYAKFGNNAAVIEYLETLKK